MKNNKVTLIFDLDETVIDSRHRTPTHADGTLNMQAYIASHTPANVYRDSLLPLARTMQRAIKAGYKVAILTARDMLDCDYDYLARHGISPRHIYSRDNYRVTKKHYAMKDGQYKAHWFGLLPKTLVQGRTVIMFDDSAPVKHSMRLLGVACLCAHKVNKRLYTEAKCV